MLKGKKIKMPRTLNIYWNVSDKTIRDMDTGEELTFGNILVSDGVMEENAEKTSMYSLEGVLNVGCGF